MSSVLCRVFYLLLSAVHYAAALQLTNLTFWHNSDGLTLKAIPGDVISVSMNANANDPRRVDLLLYNIDLKNTTAVLLSLDPIRDANVGFHIPWVPSGNFWLQIYLWPLTSLLVQSSTFQIYAPNATEKTIPPPPLIPNSSGLSPVTSFVRYYMFQEQLSLTLRVIYLIFTVPLRLYLRPDDPSATSAPTLSKNQTLIIVGVALGGVIVILLLTIVIFFFRHHKTSKSNSVTCSKIDTQSFTSPQLEDTEAWAAWKAAKRAEALREERERLDREIASIEGTVRSLTRNQ